MTAVPIAHVLFQQFSLRAPSTLSPAAPPSISCHPRNTVPEGASRFFLPGDEIALVRSAEPAVVFASLAANCVPLLCDFCVIDLIEGGLDGYRIAYPLGTRSSAAVNGFEGAASPGGHRRVHFGDDSSDLTGDLSYKGTAYFHWHDRTPTPHDTLIVGRLVSKACELLASERADVAI